MHSNIICSLHKSVRIVISNVKLFLVTKSLPRKAQLPKCHSTQHKMHCRPPLYPETIFTPAKCFEIQSFIFISIRYSISYTRALL